MLNKEPVKQFDTANKKINDSIQELAESISSMYKLDESKKNINRSMGKMLELVSPKLRFFIWNYFKRDYDIQEVLSNTLEKIIVNMHTYNTNYRFTTWAFRIARNESFLYKYEKRKDFVDIDDIFIEAIADNPEDSSIKEDRFNTLYKFIHKAIHSMKEGTAKQLLIEKDINRMPGQDIADKYGINLNTVKTKIRAARAEVSKIVNNSI